jgi:hypothetical protein
MNMETFILQNAPSLINHDHVLTDPVCQKEQESVWQLGKEVFPKEYFRMDFCMPIIFMSNPSMRERILLAPTWAFLHTKIWGWHPICLTFRIEPSQHF